MNAPQFDFGQALSIDAEAVGQPGKRRFRLLVRSSNETASIWMEKEQLRSVGDWFSEVNKRLEAERQSTDPDAEPLPFTEDVTVDFRAGQLALGYAEDRDLFLIQAFDAEHMPVAGEDIAPTFRCFVSRGQSRFLTRKIESVVAAGRQPCPLCGEPMDPAGHTCPRSNGHHLSTAP